MKHSKMMRHDCGDPSHRHGLDGFFNRREFMRVGALSGVGLTLGQYLKLQAASAEEGAAQPKAQSVILIYLAGGISHIDTFDPKPYAPIEYRGELGVVNTKIDGIQFGGLFQQTAQVADKMAIIRSM
ncbi:DUF1501 domain-containing protein, partial [Candidatus Sumerlaeota bacterium]|nr:DUF1501 domain-containing protein [Candidatus Sumerlaeota bacterium]